MSEKGEFAYVGTELEIFAHARNWKHYWTSQIQPYLQGDVLEVGAGLGTNTALLRSNRQRSWLCLEPDRLLLDQVQTTLQRRAVQQPCEVFAGTLADLDPARQFDALLYIDVLEHIQQDHAEMIRAASRLKPGGRIVVLSPAHQWLFSPFDASIGHCRRYSRETLLRTAPPSLRLERMRYLDSVGLFASLANRLFLQQNLPTVKQILLWDRMMVPLSKIIDPLLFYRFGKSILGIWRG